MQHTQCYIKDYPRPQFVRKEWHNLNGDWDFAFDDKNCGEREEWFCSGFPTGMKIRVPYSYQTSASGVKRAERHDYIWYRKEVLRPACSADRRLILWFEGSDYITKVWVNGIYIGKHEGGYCRFCFDITDAALKSTGTYTLTVKCEDTYDAAQPRGKQKWMEKPYGCWYVETNGIWKTVWTEVVSADRIGRMKFTPNKTTYCVDFDAEITGDCRGLELVTQVSREGRLVAENTLVVVRDRFSYSIDLSDDHAQFKIEWWSMAHPALYDLKFVLKRDGKAIDEVGSYFGFRAFYAQKDTLVLNNGPTYLKMVLEQGYCRDSGMTYPDEESIVRELELIKKLGFNGVRMHQKIEDERFFYYADILGIATWVEMPSAYEYRDATVDKATAEWQEIVHQHYNHPSVLAWVPINESWGVPRILNNCREQHFTQALYHLTKSYDPMRPVISNDGWEHTESDIITLHNYEQCPEIFGEFYRDLDKTLSGENISDYVQWRLPFAEGHGYRGQPVMITEFAGIGFDTEQTDGGWGYGSQVRTKEQFAERLSALVRAVRENTRICGFCVTQITDVEAEINGLCNADRTPKADMDVLAKAIRQ